MAMSRVSISAPTNIEELLFFLNKTNEHTKILAGGTDLVVAIKERGCNPGSIIDISHIKDLKYIKEDDQYIHIGAMTTFTEIQKSELIKRSAFCLYEAACLIGSKQIRNMATIGGNIANASPAADGVAALMSLQAEAIILDGNGEIVAINLDDLIIGRGNLRIRPDQIIKEIRFKKLAGGFKSAFAKVGFRSTVTISQLILSCVVKVNESTHILEHGIIALGATGTKSFIDNDTINALIGKKVDLVFKKELGVNLQNRIEKEFKKEESLPFLEQMPYKKVAILGLVDNIFAKLFVGKEKQGLCYKR